MERVNFNNYQESLDLFDRIYFSKADELDPIDWQETNDLDSDIYKDQGKDFSEAGNGKSKIVGRSVFTPKIERERDGNAEYGYSYFLTLDNQGLLTPDCIPFLEQNDILRLNITDYSRDDILAMVQSMLSMSNEEIIKMFNVQTISKNNDKFKVALFLDDAIQDYIEDKGYSIWERSYNPKRQSIITFEKGCVQIDHSIGCKEDHVYVNDNPELLAMLGDDEIAYSVFYNENGDLNIKFNPDSTDISSELGEKLFQTLANRFIDQPEFSIVTTQTEKQEEPQEELPEEPQERIQEELQEEVQEESQEELSEELPEETQEVPQEIVEEELQEEPQEIQPEILPEDLSIEELESMLQGINDDNEAKKEELLQKEKEQEELKRQEEELRKQEEARKLEEAKKKELIAKILEAQQEGKDLDSKLNDIKSKSGMGIGE